MNKSLRQSRHATGLESIHTCCWWPRLSQRVEALAEQSGLVTSYERELTAWDAQCIEDPEAGCVGRNIQGKNKKKEEEVVSSVGNGIKDGDSRDPLPPEVS